MFQTLKLWLCPTLVRDEFSCLFINHAPLLHDSLKDNGLRVRVGLGLDLSLSLSLLGLILFPFLFLLAQFGSALWGI